MGKNLVIVESPAKAKTIEGYLGKDFIVKSSFGHVRDLPKDNHAIDIEHGFKPTYVISADKREVVSQLKKLAKESEMVWLASDDDREGEAISWHLAEALNLDQEKTKRIVFREITKSAILTAIENPRDINIDLVNAQQARRVLDRLVGFELSPVLWKKIKTGLSAGRVQSVAVRLVVEREREIDRFKAESAYKITAVFEVDGSKKLEAELPQRFKQEEDARAFLEKCIGANYTIENLEKKPLKRSPAAPFTTSTLQQEASRKLSFSVSQTMTVAQKLYEAGKISYMRTDSVNLSVEAQQAAAAQITRAFGAQYAQTRHYKTKAGAQEAHEAIRPTDFGAMEVSGDRNEQRLYELIRKRAIASQMADAEIEKTTATIAISTQDAKFVATGEVIKFEGFLKVYIESKDEEEGGDEEMKGMLPPLAIGQEVKAQKVQAVQRYSRPLPRYTEASLVKKLEEMGIGRPSTYAPTISTIQKRGYIEKDNREGKERPYKTFLLQNDSISESTKTEMAGAEKAKLFPTDIAMVVNDFLVEHFPSIIDYQFTAKAEEEFDEIAHGKQQWNKMIEKFYSPFHEKVTSSESIERSAVSGARELGFHPESGKKISARLGRFGPFVQLGEENTETGEKPIYASLRKGQFLESITLEDALDLFKLPRIVGTFEDKEMSAAIGRFGPFIKHDSKFYSLPKTLDPFTVNAEEAMELIQAKRKADAEKLIKSFPENPEIQVLNGRFGPYIVAGKKNVKIPKGKEPKDLTLEECLELAAATPDKPARGRFGKKAEPAKETADKPASKKKAPAKKAAAKTTETKAKATTTKKAAPKKKAE